MKAITHLLDKLLFTALLLIALQVPQLADQLQQYLAGYRDALAGQVAEYRLIAQRNGFADLQAMIDEHKYNPSASVRDEAELKVRTLALLADVDNGVELFETGTIWHKSWFMLQPRHRALVSASLRHFSPGLPLRMDGIVFGLVVGLILYLLVLGTVSLFSRLLARHLIRHG